MDSESAFHHQLLEQETATVSFSDLEEINRLFDLKVSSWECASANLSGATMDALRLRKLLTNADKLTDRHVLIALAALRYFIRDEDHTHDTNHDCGGEDDFLVIQAAIQELQEPLRLMSI